MPSDVARPLTLPSAPARALVIPLLLLTLPVLAGGHAVAADAGDARIGPVERVRVELSQPPEAGGALSHVSYHATLDFPIPERPREDVVAAVTGAPTVDVGVRRVNASTVRVTVPIDMIGNATALPARVLDVVIVNATTREPMATRSLDLHVVRPVIRLPAAFVPVRALPLGWASVGGSPFVSFHTEPVPPASPFTLRVDAGDANGTVHALVTGHGVHARLAPTRAGADVRFRPADVLGNASTGLLAVTATVTDAREDAVTVGASTLVLPAVTGTARVSDVTATNGNVTVRVTTDAGDARAGTIAFLKGPRVLALANASPAGDARVAGRVPAAVLEDAVTTGQYTIAAFVTRADGAVHAVASATRGFRVTASDVDVTRTEQAGVPVRVVNLNANADGTTDAGLEATVRFRVSGLPGVDDAVVNEITLAEAANGTLVFPLGVPRDVGTFPVRVEATLGELSLVTHANVTVTPSTSALQDALARTPTAGALPVLALAFLALARSRRVS